MNFSVQVHCVSARSTAICMYDVCELCLGCQVPRARFWVRFYPSGLPKLYDVYCDETETGHFPTKSATITTWNWREKTMWRYKTLHWSRSHVEYLSGFDLKEHVCFCLLFVDSWICFRFYFIVLLIFIFLVWVCMRARARVCVCVCVFLSI